MWRSAIFLPPPCVTGPWGKRSGEWTIHRVDIFPRCSSTGSAARRPPWLPGKYRPGLTPVFLRPTCPHHFFLPGSGGFDGQPPSRRTRPPPLPCPLGRQEHQRAVDFCDQANAPRAVRLNDQAPLRLERTDVLDACPIPSSVGASPSRWRRARMKSMTLCWRWVRRSVIAATFHPFR